ncbi:MAG: NfeD family protein [Opitutaceae bacterium]
MEEGQLIPGTVCAKGESFDFALDGLLRRLMGVPSLSRRAFGDALSLGLKGLLAVAASGLAAVPGARAAPKTAVVIPIHDEIAEPTLYIVRRGLKEAEASHADLVILDMDTPGGALDVTVNILEALRKYPGETAAFVDDQAMSAGAIISGVTDEIWFVPTGVMGAAAPVTSTGQDIGTTMKEKLVSYLTARMRAAGTGKRYRGEVVSAMINSDSELKIDGVVLKPKGTLLTVTAAEASKRYGHPPVPLLAAGIAKSVDDLLAQKFGPGNFTVRTLRKTWSEGLAVILNGLAPVLTGLGLLSLFVAFKTSSFGLFGTIGIGLLAIEFFGSSVAGLSGHEPVLVFAIGAVLVVLELIFWHSAGFLGAAGAGLMLGSLVWGMADLWPNEPLHVAWDTDAFGRPLANMGLGIALAVILGSLLLRFLPQGWIWDRLVIGATVGGAAQAGGGAPGESGSLDTLVGRVGIAATALRPGGQVEVAGRRYEATVPVGAIDAGSPVVVRGRTDFGLVVEKAP